MACIKSPWSEKNMPAAVPVASLLNRLGFSLVQSGLFQFARQPLPSAEQEAGIVPFDRKIEYKTQNQTMNERSQSLIQEHCRQCQGQPTVLKPPDPPLCNYNSLKLFIMGWTVSSCSSALDTYRVPLASCLQEWSRERDDHDKPNKGRAWEKQELLDRKGRDHPRMQKEEMWAP